MHLAIDWIDWLYDYFFIDASDIVSVIMFWIVVMCVVSIIVLPVVLIVIAILHEYVEEGEVVEKIHEPERWWTQIIPMRVGSVLVFIPFRHYDDEDWVIVVKGKTSKGKLQEDRFYVSKERWDSVNVGEWIVVSGQDETMDPHERTRASSEG